MSLPTNPLNRKEAYLNAIATGNTVDMPTKPITREEAYLDAIAKNGGGSGGAENYSQLNGKPQINNVELASGNNSLSSLGIQGKLTFDNVPTDGSNNPVKSDGIYDSEKDIYAVMGEMGAKNLNKFPYKNGGAGDVWSTNGIDFTVLADGSIDVNRASSSSNPAYFRCGISTENFNPIYLEAGEKYILSGSVSGVGVNLRDSTNATVASSSSGEEELFNCSNSGNYYIIISVSKDASPVHALVKPMLRLASDTDDTYQQYAKTNKQLTDDVAANTSAIEAIENVTGAKNLLNSVSHTEISALSGNNGTYTNTITDARSYVELVVDSWHENTLLSTLVAQVGIFQTGEYEFNITIPNSTNYLRFKHNGIQTDFSVYFNCNLVGNYVLSLKFTGVDPTTVGGTTFGNIMIRPAGTDPTYAPYAMTNRELTERVSGGSLSVETYQVTLDSDSYSQWGWVYVVDKNGNSVTPADGIFLQAWGESSNAVLTMDFVVIAEFGNRWMGRVRKVGNIADVTGYYGTMNFSFLRIS